MMINRYKIESSNLNPYQECYECLAKQKPLDKINLPSTWITDKIPIRIDYIRLTNQDGVHFLESWFHFFCNDSLVNEEFIKRYNENRFDYKIFTEQKQIYPLMTGANGKHILIPNVTINKEGMIT